MEASQGRGSCQPPSIVFHGASSQPILRMPSIPRLCPPLHCMHRLLIALAPSATTDGCAGGADGGAGVAVGTLKVFELQRGVSSP